MKIDELISGKARRVREIASRNGARRLRFFGSFARGSATPESDVDVLVSLDEGRDLLDLAGLMLELEDLLGRTVDVVEEETVPAEIMQRILAEAVEP